VKQTGAASYTTVTDPQGNVTTIYFQGIYETQRFAKDSSNNLLLTRNTCYNSASIPCTGTAITQPITTVTVSTILPGSQNLTDQHVYTYDGYGNLLGQSDYDYGPAAKGNLLAQSTITYASLGNITAFRKTVTLADGSGHTVSQTNYNYDETGVVTTSGTPQHTSVSGSRGNLTSVNYYTQGSTYLTRSYTYFDTGNVQTATDVNGAQTTYTYGACGNSFPTTVIEPLSMSKTYAWDTNCAGGVMTSVKDENAQTTTTAYSDAYFWRPASVTDPAGAVTTYYYQPNPTYCCPWEVMSSLNFNNGNSITNDTQYLDGLGRTYVDQHQNVGSSNLDSASYTFDASGRPTITLSRCRVQWAGPVPAPHRRPR
jgi:hypothetical protein